MTDKHSLSQSQRRTFTPYVMIWALLASLSLAYLVILFAQPGSVSRFMGGSHGVPDEELRAIARAAGEVPFLRESVGQARMEIDEIKAELAKQTALEGELAGRIAALEARQQEAAKAPDAVPASPAAARAQPDKRAERAPAKPSARLPQEAKAEALAGTDDLPGGANQAAAAPKTAAKKPAKPVSDDIPEIGLETGSVSSNAKAPVTFGTATVTRSEPIPPKTYGLQIGTGPSVDALRTQWHSLAITHSDSLGPFQPRYVSGADPAAGAYDLVVGPVASAGEAKRLCKELALKGTPCKVGDYTGNAF